MACKPKRRRHNKQVPAFYSFQHKDGVIEQIPLNRKARAVTRRQTRIEALKAQMYGVSL